MGLWHRWARGGGSGGFYPVWKFFYDPLLRFKMTPTPSEMAFDPLKDFELATFVFFRKDIKKICPEKKNFAGLRRHQFLAKEGQNSDEILAWDPPDPLCFNFYEPPLAKQSFDPPLEMTTLLTYGLWNVNCVIVAQPTLQARCSSIPIMHKPVTSFYSGHVIDQVWVKQRCNHVDRQ